MKRDSGKIIKSFDCRAAVNIKLILLATTCIMAFMFGLFELYFSNSGSALTGKILTKGLIGLLSGLVLAAMSVSVFVTQKKCYISVNENAISGLKPSFPCRAKYFDIYYEDIIKIYNIILPTSRALPMVLIKTKSKPFFFACLGKEDLQFLLSHARRKLKKSAE